MRFSLRFLLIILLYTYIWSTYANATPADKKDSVLTNIKVHADLPLIEKDHKLFQELKYASTTKQELSVTCVCYTYDCKGDSTLIYSIRNRPCVFEKGTSILKLPFSQYNDRNNYLLDNFYKSFVGLNAIPFGQYKLFISFQSKDSQCYSYVYAYAIDSTLVPYSSIKRTIDRVINANITPSINNNTLSQFSVVATKPSKVLARLSRKLDHALAQKGFELKQETDALRNYLSIYFNAKFVGRYVIAENTPILEQVSVRQNSVKQNDQQQIDKSQAGIYAFANWWQGASDYINTISPDLLGSISYDSDPALAVNNYLNSSNGDINKLHEAVAASSDGAPNLQRLASLLQVNLSPTNITSPYVDVLKTQQMRLAEQPIYGSSRVGVASYWPGQYDAVWDYTTGTQDTLRLLGIKPWYSATLEGYKPAGSTEPYDNSSLGLASAAHLLGQKSYELSNHLGNVQATLSDKRYVQKQYYTASDSLRKGFAASVSSLYDYYPFGMLMKERCTSDTATQSVYMSQVVYSPQYTTVNNAMTGASITSLNTTTQTNYNGSVNYFGQSASINKTLSNLQSGIPVSMKINLLYTNKPLYLTVQQGSTLLYSTTMNSSGTYSFNFTPTQSTVQLSIAYSYFNTNANTLCFTLDSVNYTQQNGSTSSTQLVQISSKQNDKYRFGYGGHEKMNEISGLGNTIDMGDRWLNTRIGRTPKTDLHKIKYPNLSPYSYAANNPIVFYDPDGKDYRLSIIKNNQGKILIVSAHATVYLQGAGASQEMANNLNKQFLDKYNGYKNVDGVNVAFFVNYIYDGKNEKNKNNLGMGQNIFEIRTDLEKDYRSRVFAESHVLGSKFQTGNTGIINYKSSKFSQTVFHETLHLMGLSDRYDEFNNNLFKGIEIHKGFNKDIMGGGDKILDVHYENLLNYAKSKNMSFILQDNKQYDRASLSELKNGSKPNTTYHEMSEQAKNK